MILSSIIKHLKNLDLIDFPQIESIINFNNAVIRNILILAGPCGNKANNITDEIMKILTTRIKKTDYVISTEEERLDLIAASIKEESALIKHFQILNDFLGFNRKWLEEKVEKRKLIHPLNLKPSFEPKTVNISVTNEFQKLRSIAFDEMKTKTKWDFLIKELAGRLNDQSLGHLLASREDLLFCESENAIKVRQNYSL